jgi:tRNA threonylcarbamoyladenosine biosynthesis protein TsaB
VPASVPVMSGQGARGGPPRVGPVVLIDTSTRPAWVGLASPPPPGEGTGGGAGVWHSTPATRSPRRDPVPPPTGPLPGGGGALLLVRELGTGRRDGDRLVAELMRLLDEAGVGLATLAALVVARGPGSFTGLRSGIAAAQGLARASGVPLVGIDSLELAARAVAGAAGERVAPLAAGRGGRVYGALFETLGGGEVRRIEAVAERTLGEWRERCPPGTRFVLAGGAVAEIADYEAPSRTARLMAAVQFAAAAPRIPPDELLPLYVRDWM